jgi:hypothetical protein
LHPTISEIHPGIDVRGELAVAHEHDVTGLEGKGASRDVDAEAGVGRQRNLADADIEETGRKGPRAGQGAELDLLGDAMGRGAEGGARLALRLFPLP